MKKELKFSIITPTYRRPESLTRCVQSVLNQNHENWEMIIVDDGGEKNENSEDFAGDFGSNFGDKNKQVIKFFTNKKNMGNNFSKNFALEKLSEDSNYIIFLDDDDWLHPNALENINDILNEEEAGNKKEIKWLVTNRSIENKSLTKNNTKKNTINYFWDYLIFKKFSGDATHIIKTDLAKNYKFSGFVKNGEEVFYFIQLPFDFIYKNINITNTEGYKADGMTADLKNKYTGNTKLLWQEKLNIKLFVYLLIRTVYSYAR